MATLGYDGFPVVFFFVAARGYGAEARKLLARKFLGGAKKRLRGGGGWDERSPRVFR